MSAARGESGSLHAADAGRAASEHHKSSEATVNVSLKPNLGKAAHIADTKINDKAFFAHEIHERH